ncbi:hypothetical protein MRX96_030932 [Rhipicephalus microplus]
MHGQARRHGHQHSRRHCATRVVPDGSRGSCLVRLSGMYTGAKITWVPVLPQLAGHHSAMLLRVWVHCASKEGSAAVPRGRPEGLHRSPSIYYRTRTERWRKDYIRAPCRSIKSAWRAPKPTSPLLMAGSQARRSLLPRPETCNASGSARPLAADRIRRLEQQLPLCALGSR